MTNLSPKQSKKNTFITPENAVLFIPIFISLFITSILISAFIIPQSFKSKKTLEQIKFLEEKISFIPIYNNKLQEIKIKKNKALNQQGRLISLVAGEKDLKTLLNKLNGITISNKIKIIEIKPIIERELILSKSSDNKQNIKDPLLQPSLEKYSFTLIAEGQYNDLIGMLKEIEMLETFIIAENLKIQSIKNKDDESNILTRLTIELTAYGRKTI